MKPKRANRPTVQAVVLHCPLDGEELHEIGLGLLACENCGMQFIPTSDGQWAKEHPDSEMLSLSWVVENVSNDVSEGSAAE